MQVKKRKIRRALSKLRMETKQSHHKNAYFSYKGVQYFKTRVSHGEGDSPGIVVRRIQKNEKRGKRIYGKTVFRAPLL